MTLRRVLILISYLAALPIGQDSGILHAQDAVVSNTAASELKARYPFVRFSVLAGFDVPKLDVDMFALSPHAATPLASGTLRIPPDVAALDGHAVSVRGYMLPVTLEGGGVTKFLLTATIDSCHFGMIGQANEWIMVTMAAGRHVPFPKGTPMTVFGRLAVKPQMRNGGLAGLYELTADVVTVH
jgi:hypothetical protein